jgi:hypothetical protein
VRPWKPYKSLNKVTDERDVYWHGRIAKKLHASGWL